MQYRIGIRIGYAVTVEADDLEDAVHKANRNAEALKQNLGSGGQVFGDRLDCTGIHVSSVALVETDTPRTG